MKLQFKTTIAVPMVLMFILVGAHTAENIRGGGTAKLISKAISESAESEEREMVKTTDRLTIDGEDYMIQDSELNDAFDAAIQETMGKNLFDVDASISGFITDVGLIDTTTPTTFITSDYIPVESGTYTLSDNGTAINLTRYITYDQDKERIDYSASGSSPNITITNAKYIRFSVNAQYYKEVQFEKGSTATAYEAYIITRELNGSEYATQEELKPYNEYIHYNNNKIRYDLCEGKEIVDGTNTTDGVRTDGAYGNYINIKFYMSEIYGDGIVFMGTYTGSGFVEILFYKENGTRISAFVNSPIGTSLDGGRLFKISDCPADTHYFIVNFKKSEASHAYQYKGNTPIEDLSVILNIKKMIPNVWYGKKVVWLGTSISFGQYATICYPEIAANVLGFNLVNTSFPGISLDVNSDSDTWSSALSIEEQAERGLIIPDTPEDYYPHAGMPNDYYRTYEHIFDENTADADLYVYAVLPNNTNWATTDWELFDKTLWKYTDDSSFASHRGTFLGALIFMMDKMYQSNPNARMVFCVDLDGNSNTYGVPQLEMVSEAFGIPIINLWKKLQYNPKTKSLIRYTDGVHLNNYAHEHMGNMMAGEMALVN